MSKVVRITNQAVVEAPLDGLHVALLFEKPSLRTRSTFEIASASSAAR
jgi:ornithine carbamoyltransferase